MSLAAAITGFFRELRRRRVFRVAAAYLIAGWAVIEVATAVEGPLALPGWTDTLVIVLVALGFPITLVLSWALQLTPDGVRLERSEPGSRRTADSPRGGSDGAADDHGSAPATDVPGSTRVEEPLVEEPLVDGRESTAGEGEPQRATGAPGSADGDGESPSASALVDPTAGEVTATAGSAAEPSTAATPEAAAPDAHTLPPEGERRHACVLIVRVTRYTELVERMAPDRLEASLERLETETRATVEAHGGVVNEVGEEELVGLFGVPLTHEDHFVRGVRAALALRDRLEAGTDEQTDGGESVGIGLGLATGRIVARPSRSSDGGRYRISGGAVGVARRLARLAARAEVLVSEDCAQLIQYHYATEAMEPVPGGDADRSLRPHRVLGELSVRTALEAAERVGLTTYVGRERELETLESAYRSASESSGRLVMVEGEAGVGKSRLLHEFRRSLEGDEARVLRGRCRAEGDAGPYHPFIEALRDLLTLDEGNASAGDRAELVVERIREIAPELEDQIAFYLHLLSLEDRGIIQSVRTICTSGWRSRSRAPPCSPSPHGGTRSSSCSKTGTGVTRRRTSSWVGWGRWRRHTPFSSS